MRSSFACVRASALAARSVSSRVAQPAGRSCSSDRPGNVSASPMVTGGFGYTSWKPASGTRGKASYAAAIMRLMGRPQAQEIDYLPRLAIGSHLGRELRMARGGRGLRSTAQDIGISHGYLVLLEQGKRAPTRPVADELLRVLRLDSATSRRLLEEAEEVEAARESRRLLAPARRERAGSLIT